MGWARGKDKNGKDIGYAIPETCQHYEGCSKEIDRGLAHKCGGVTSLHENYGCEDYLCSRHLWFGNQDQLCAMCYEAEHPENFLED